MFEIIAILAVVLDSFKLFGGHPAAGFTRLPQDDANSVGWLANGPANLMSKLTQIFVNLDHRIGRAF